MKMKLFIYLILAIIGLTGTITGTIRLSAFNIPADHIGRIVITTFICIILFTLFGYAFHKGNDELN